MTTTYLPAPGVPVEPMELQVAKARELVRMLRSRRVAFVELVGCLRQQAPDDTEVVVIEVVVERGQHIIHDIHLTERVAVRFFADDQQMPEVLALREDFPLVPHLNLRPEGFPRSLCLFEEPYDEVKLRWTASWFVERIRTWLALTAKGELHAPDQPLEPLLLGAAAPLILPMELFDELQSAQPARLVVYPVENEAGYVTLFASIGDREDLRPKELPCVATVLWGNAQPHGIIQQQPRTIKHLHAFMEHAGADVLGSLRERLWQWQHGSDISQILDRRLVIIVFLPKTRDAGASVEATDIYAFVSTIPVGIIGEQLGVWQLHDGKPGAVLIPDLTRQGEEVELVLLNPMANFSRERAAALGGLPDPGRRPIAAIGLGALGSQVFSNLMRMGYAPWTLIDKDVLLPHNLARHALGGWAVGHTKAHALAIPACRTLNDPNAMTPMVVDVLRPGKHEAELTQALTDATAILDMSASISVARTLVCDHVASARRISLFLNPAGTDLVLLAEDSDRRTPLDLLEMQYYRLLVQEEALNRHLQMGASSQRYARSCRDVSAMIPQDLMALHAGIGSRAFRIALAESSAQIVVWQAHPDDMTVTRVQDRPARLLEQRQGEWTIITDSWLIEQLHSQRLARLPNETGGVLIGALDLQRRRIYVVINVPSPPDSSEWPTGYIRGCRDLTQRVKQIAAITAQNLGYVGEWHSHPRGHSCVPSTDDRRVLRWLADERAIDGLPALMAIVSEDACGWYLEDTLL
jgi:Prokaryotic E2 family A/Prokaryotic homologs of the JAB domain/ThiF family